ncbi:DUF488 domain-containing protein [Halomonas dongshanensis]|uniref:DUF488 family protein n=1 Tax=Halomonas dongshanensis TaxID=2890835 RepID=A0ABT2EFV8_9GAMM|nr:DUF488 family protein [Halomonas dongshanensis]MCS2610466.1 DUF488 family protein [Halomonas dongshanensis]
MDIALKRAYDKPAKQDGHRVLVDGLWPRGVSKDEAKIAEWRKEIAPSQTIRKAFHDGSLAWGEFRRRYLKELMSHRDLLRDLAKRAQKEKVTLVFAAKDEDYNNAVIVRQYLKMLG